MSKWGKSYADKADAFASTGYWLKASNRIVGMLPGRGHVLDLGCNTGKFIELAQKEHPYLDFVGVDPNKDALATLGKKFPGVPGYTTQREVPDKSMNVVVCIHSLIQMEDQIGEMREAYRTLRTGGRIILLTHNRHNKKVWWLPNLITGYTPDPTVNRTFSKKELKALMEEAGFITEKLEYDRPTPQWMAWLPIFNQHLFYVGRKIL